MKAIILAAGFGTRLAPHTRRLPKALFPVAGVPVLGHMIQALKRAGCSQIAVNTHHLAQQIEAYLSTNDFGLPVQASHEDEILGTGGAIRRLADFVEDVPFMVVNADILTDIDLADVYRRHLDHTAPVTLVMHDRPPFNQVRIKNGHQIVGFKRFSAVGDPVDQMEMAFTGIHVIDSEVVSWIPENGFCDIISVYRHLLDQNVSIRAHVVTGHDWQDMGSPDRYRDAVLQAMAPGVFRSVFPGANDASIRCRPLAGDGSDRNWFRLSAGRHHLVVVDHGITPVSPGSEANAFVKIGRHLYDRGLPAPRIHAHDRFSGLVFLEDLGDCHLQQRVQQVKGTGRTETLYRRAIDIWLDLTVKAADGFDPAWTCQSRAYDTALILDKECRYFVDAFCNGYLQMQVPHDELLPEFTRLARNTIDHGVVGLIHRDFQSRNIMIRNDRLYLIDFQGARSGPIQYDLAALLIDPYVGLNANLQKRLLAYAAAEAARRLHCDPKGFIRGYHYCTVTRNLQMLGAFGFLSRVKGKSAFERWIPVASAMLAAHLRIADAHAFPKLSAIAKSIDL